MAERLGVSRASVREAIRILGAVGIVEVKNGKGVYVCDFSLGAIADHMPYGLEFHAADAVELIEIRRLLEVYAIRRIAQTITTEQLDNMRSVITTMQAKAWREEDFIEDDICTVRRALLVA